MTTASARELPNQRVHRALWANANSFEMEVEECLYGHSNKSKIQSCPKQIRRWQHGMAALRGRFYTRSAVLALAFGEIR